MNPRDIAGERKKKEKKKKKKKKKRRQSSSGTGLKGIDVFSENSEWRSHEPKTQRRAPTMTETFQVITRNEL